MGCDYDSYKVQLQIMQGKDPERYGDYTVLDFFLEEISEGRIPDFNYINWRDFIRFYVDLEPKSDGTGILANPFPKLEPFIDKIKDKDQRLNILNYFYHNDNDDVFGHEQVDDTTHFKEECSRLARKYGEKILIREKLTLLEIAEAINRKRYYNIKHFLCYGIKWQEIKPEYIIPVNNLRTFADSIKDDVVRLEVLKFLQYQGDRLFHDMSDAHGVTASMADYLAELDRLIKLNEYTYKVPDAAKMPLPRPDNYVDLVNWIKEEKNEGRNYYAEAGNNRSKMCRNLTEKISWEVNENSLRKAQQRL